MNSLITEEELLDLPDELVKQLILPQKTKIDDIIIDIFRKHGPELSTNHVVIYYYKKTGVICKRQNLAARLYKLNRIGVLDKVPGEVGCFKLLQIERRK